MRILVTGAAGLVGAELVARLAAEGHGVVALVHKNGVLMRNDGTRVPLVDCPPPEVPAGSVATIGGDAAAADFGWPAPLAQSIAESVDLVVHGAAVTRFGLPAAVYHTVNHGGTCRLLDWLARNRRAGLVYVSTAYVCGERRGRVREAPLDRPRAFGNAYEESKYLAEQEVHAAAETGRRVAVARPAIIVGDEREGRIRQFKDIYLAVRLATAGKVTSLPANYDATLELAAIDHVVEGLVHMARAFDRAAGRTIHLVSGAVTMRDVSDVIAEHPSLVAPRYVAPYAFDVARMPHRERRLYEKVMRLYESYFRRQLDFDDEELAAIGGRPAAVRGVALLRKMFDFAALRNYLQGPADEKSDAAGEAAG